MTKDELITNWVSGILLSVGTGTWTAYDWLKEISDWCRVLLPILSVISFTIVILINMKRFRSLIKKKTP